jgi:hypothetical protein
MKTLTTNILLLCSNKLKVQRTNIFVEIVTFPALKGVEHRNIIRNNHLDIIADIHKKLKVLYIL